MASFIAHQLSGPNAPFEQLQKTLEGPPRGKVRVQVHACGICHGDVVPKFGLLGTTFPRVPGHEIAGTVHALGEGVTQWKLGDRVGLGWYGGCCYTCRSCREGDFLLCDSLTVTGAHVDGGYQQFVIADANALAPIPDALTFLEAAPLMCAGLTVFNGLRRVRALQGGIVGVQGIGGLGHLAIQYASKMGFEVAAFSRGKEKEAEAKRLGACYFFDTNDAGFVEKVKVLGGVLVLIATAPSAAAMTAVVPTLAHNGTLLALGVGGPHDCSMHVDPGCLIAGRRAVLGFPSGTPADAEDALKFAALHGVRSVNEVFPAAQAAEAFDRMMSKKAIFRVVIDYDSPS